MGEVVLKHSFTKAKRGQKCSWTWVKNKMICKCSKKAVIASSIHGYCRLHAATEVNECWQEINDLESRAADIDYALRKYDGAGLTRDCRE